jgi:hypothetical protein
MRAGTVLEMIAGEFTKIYTERKSGSNDHGDWSMQNATFRDDDGNTIKVQFKNQDLIPQSWAGRRVEITTVGDKKAKGISVDEYQGVKRLVLYPTVDYAWIEGGRREEPRRQDPPPREEHRRNDPPPRNDPPHREEHRRQEAPSHEEPRRQEAPASPRRPGPLPIHGATVGMALNQASRILTESVSAAERLDYFLSPKYLHDLYTVASGIVRVSQHMERGHLAPKWEATPPPQQRAARPPADPEDPDSYMGEEKTW